MVMVDNQSLEDKNEELKTALEGEKRKAQTLEDKVKGLQTALEMEKERCSKKNDELMVDDQREMKKEITQLIEQMGPKEKGKGKVEKGNVKSVNTMIATISGELEQDSPVDSSTKESKVELKEVPGKIEAPSEEPNVSSYEPKGVVEDVFSRGRVCYGWSGLMNISSDSLSYEAHIFSVARLDEEEKRRHPPVPIAPSIDGGVGKAKEEESEEVPKQEKVKRKRRRRRRGRKKKLDLTLGLKAAMEESDPGAGDILPWDLIYLT
ncbi:hypothetical protein Dimus_024899 [Dionaea muscipula]